MEFDLDKCSKCTIRAGKKVAAENMYIGEQDCTEHLAVNSTYKYLGIENNATLEHKK